MIFVNSRISFVILLLKKRWIVQKKKQTFIKKVELNVDYKNYLIRLTVMLFMSEEQIRERINIGDPDTHPEVLKLYGKGSYVHWQYFIQGPPSSGI